MKFYMKEGEGKKFWTKKWINALEKDHKNYIVGHVRVTHWFKNDTYSLWNRKSPYNDLFITYTEMCYIKLCNGKGVEIVPTS